MKIKKEYDTTMNRYVYNRLRKLTEANCSFCRWHKVDNQTTKWYHIDEDGNCILPNWKLVSKCRHQYQRGEYKTRQRRYHIDTSKYLEIII